MDLPGMARWPASRSRSPARPTSRGGASSATTRGGRAVVVGLSLGGYVAMDSRRVDPTLVRGLVLSGARPSRPVAAGVPLALAWVMDRVAAPAARPLNAWFFRTPFPAGDRRPDHRRRVLVGGRRRRPCGPSPRALRAASGRVPGPDPVRQRRSATCSSACPPRRSRARHGTRAESAWTARTHLANLDRPSAFSRAVRRFAGSFRAIDALSTGPGRPGEVRATTTAILSHP